MKAISILIFILLCSCGSKEYETEYPKRVYTGSAGESAYMINDSILIIADRKGVSYSDTKVFNLKKQ